MKNKIILIVTLIISISCFSQSRSHAEQEVKNSIIYFVNSLKSKKVDQAIECIYPKFFTITSKEQTSNVLNFTYNNPMVKMTINKISFSTIGKPELIEKEYYSIAQYYLNLDCDVHAMNDQMKDTISKMLTSKYGKENVKYNSAKSVFNINAFMKTCAISSDQKKWKLVLLEKEMRDKLKSILPQKIIDKI